MTLDFKGSVMLVYKETYYFIISRTYQVDHQKTGQDHNATNLNLPQHLPR